MTRRKAIVGAVASIIALPLLKGNHVNSVLVVLDDGYSPHKLEKKCREMGWEIIDLESMPNQFEWHGQRLNNYRRNKYMLYYATRSTS